MASYMMRNDSLILTSNNPESTVVIDLGGTNLRLGHIGADGPHPAAETLPTERLRQAEPIGFLVSAVKRYVQENNLTLAGVVIGVPFTPDRELSTAVSSPNIRNLEGAPLKAGLSEKLGCPVRLERDINLLALGEWAAGAVRGVASVFGMFVGTGVGGCYLEDGQPFRGSTGAALELGHIPIRAEGRVCVCGNTDCVEAYACGSVLNRIADEAQISVGEIFTQGLAGLARPDLKPILDTFVDDLARTLSTGVNLFHPEVALVGGGVMEMPGFPKKHFQETFYAHLRRPIPAETVTLRWAELGSRASLYGAQVLLRRARADA